ncbi:MAG TPA: hypothetical protein VJ570_09590 [Holophagaceae bacterium]|nr:hypothetical protein [Holophagaceae bacterium]
MFHHLPMAPQPWLFSPRLDLLAFGGSFLLALAVVALGSATGRLAEPLPLGLWLVLVVGVDVAHVHATWLRTYLDPREVRSHPWRYLLVPALAYLGGVAVHQFGALPFWRALAYLAVFHFIRQQAGWISLYQREEARSSAWDRRLDQAAVYAATLWPLAWWHAHLPRPFSWFVAGDFAALVPPWAVDLTFPLYAGLLAAFLLRQAWLALREGTFRAGKTLVLGTTALGWYLGIVRFHSDWAFTALNVLPHGIPYAVLVWQRSARAGAASGPAAALVKAGPALFASLLLLVALGEEWIWDLGIWHDHPALFGEGWNLGATAQMWLVPLLALPQAVHYLLDGFIWRRPSRG